MGYEKISNQIVDIASEVNQTYSKLSDNGKLVILFYLQTRGFNLFPKYNPNHGFREKKIQRR